MAQRTRSSVIMCFTSVKFSDGNHLGILSCLEWFSTWHPGKCVSRRCKYASSKLEVHCPLGRRNIPSLTVGERPRILYSLVDSWILSVRVQKFCHSWHLLCRSCYTVVNNRTEVLLLLHMSGDCFHYNSETVTCLWH